MTAVLPLVLLSFGPRHLQQCRLFSPLVTSVQRTEEAAISAARKGLTPARSSREDGYMAIPKPGGTNRDWLAMIAYLVTELDVSRRAVTDQDLRQLKK